MFAMPDGVPALIVLVAFIAVGRFAAEVYAQGPAQRVSIVAMVVAAPFWLWATYNTVFDSLDLGVFSLALAGLAGAYGYELLPVGYTQNGFRAAATVGFGAVCVNYILGLTAVVEWGLITYFAVAEAFWLGMLYSAFASTSGDPDILASAYTSLV
jgi:hypothetical protein